MANAIQTVMSNTAEAFLLRDGANTVTFDCSGGGTLSYSGSFAGIDLDAGAGTASFPAIFSDCIIKVCGDSLTFSSDGSATITISALSPDQVGSIIGGGAIIGEGEDFFEIELAITDKTVTGFVEGVVSFAYKMRIVGSTAGLSEIQIVESESGGPISISGSELPAASLSTLADRC